MCEVQNIVSQAESDIVKHMNQQQLNTFNAFIDNTITTLSNQCGALNCLNATNLAPSSRNAATNDNCVSVIMLCMHQSCAAKTLLTPASWSQCWEP